MNYCFLIGRVAEEPILKVAKTGVSYCRFHLVVDREFTVRDGEKRGYPRKHDSIDCIAWRRQAEAIKRYVTKGHLLLVVGKIEVWNAQNPVTKVYMKHTTVRVIQAQIFDWRKNVDLVPRGAAKKDTFDALFDGLNEVYNKVESEKAKSEPDLNIDSEKFAGTSNDPYMPSDYDYDVDYGDLFEDEDEE